MSVAAPITAETKVGDIDISCVNRFRLRSAWWRVWFQTHSFCYFLIHSFQHFTSFTFRDFVLHSLLSSLVAMDNFLVSDYFYSLVQYSILNWLCPVTGHRLHQHEVLAINTNLCGRVLCQAFTHHINSVLKGDKDLPFLPMDEKSRDLYKVGRTKWEWDSVRDGSD